MPSSPARPSAPFRWGEVVADVPRAVWAISALHLVLLACWTLLTPVWEAPDEPQHFDLARAIAEEGAYPEYDERYLSEQVTATFPITGFSETGNPLRRTREPVIAPDAPPREARPAFDELGEDEPTPHINPAPQHPPLYYALASLLLLATPDSAAFDVVVWVLRLLNVALLAPVPLLAFAAARRLTGDRVAAVLAPILLLAVPQYLHIGGTVNNDNLLTLLFAGLTVLTVAVSGGDLGWRTAVWIGLLGALAMVTKGFALILPAWVGAAYVVGLVRRRALGAGVRTGAIAVGGMLLLGGWWWLRNLVVHGDIQTTVQRFGDANPGFEPTFGRWADRAFPFLIERFWGSFGWVDVTLPDGVVGTAAWTLGILVALAFAVRPVGARWWRADLLVLLLPVVCTLAVLVYGSYETYAQSGRLTGMQGRYLFPGLPALGAVVAAGLGALARRWVGALPLVALLAAGWIQWIATRMVLHFWYGHPGITDLRISAAALRAWAPVPQGVLVALALAAALAAAWATAEAVLLARAAAASRPAVPVEAGDPADAAPPR